MRLRLSAKQAALANASGFFRPAVSAASRTVPGPARSSQPESCRGVLNGRIGKPRIEVIVEAQAITEQPSHFVYRQPVAGIAPWR